MKATPSQTIGPFFTIGLADRPCDVGPLTLEGRVLDGAGDPVPDALVEVWSPQSGFGRCATDGGGRYAFRLCDTSHVDVQVFARGLLKQVRTRVAIENDRTTFDVRLQETSFFVV